jgi:hypothetical protein
VESAFVLCAGENDTSRTTDRRRLSSGDHEMNPIGADRAGAPRLPAGEGKATDDDPQPHFTPRLGFHHLADEYKGDEVCVRSYVSPDPC